MNEKLFLQLRPFDAKTANIGDKLIDSAFKEVTLAIFPGPDNMIGLRDEKGNATTRFAVNVRQSPLCFIDEKPVYPGDVMYWKEFVKPGEVQTWAKFTVGKRLLPMLGSVTSVMIEGVSETSEGTVMERKGTGVPVDVLVWEMPTEPQKKTLFINVYKDGVVCSHWDQGEAEKSAERDGQFVGCFAVEWVE